jgi:hypothetical protein
MLTHQEVKHGRLVRDTFSRLTHHRVKEERIGQKQSLIPVFFDSRHFLLDRVSISVGLFLLSAPIFSGHRQMGEKCQKRQGRTSFALALVLVVLLVAADTLAAQDVRYNFMPGTDFAKYHTYKWVDIKGAAHRNQIVDAQIKQSVDSQLASKGLTKTEDDNADLYVGYQIAVDKEKQWNGYTWAVVSVSGEWRLLRAPQSTSELWFLICMTLRPSNWSGLEMRPRPLIPARTRKRTRRIWTRPCRSC